MIVIYTCVYNSETTLPETIESVLRQSYRSFEFHIEDNGSTDGTRAIIDDYAERDSRIVPHIREKNHTLTGEPPPILTFLPPESEFFTNIDGDDWWEPDYLERLVTFAEQFHLDIACTGTKMHDIASGNEFLRQVQYPLVVEKKQFAEAFPFYHVFFRTIWGKLIRTKLLLRIRLPGQNSTYSYGADTAYSFQLLRQASRIGIDNSVLHHYRILHKSVSYQYNSKRFESDVYLYHDAIDFLSAFGPISAQNRNFLQCVYSNAVIDTIGVIQNSSLSSADKLREYRTIATHAITVAAYRECTDKSANRSKTNLIVRALEAGAGLEKADDEDLRLTMQTLLPHCGQAVSATNVRMFLEDRQLLQALLQDDADKVLEDLLSRAEQNQGVKKYGIPAALQALTADNILLCQINDAVFLRKYAEIYKMVWKDERLAALDKMAGLLLEGKVNSGQETFLTLFVALAAVENQPEAFVFGKLQLGKLYLRQNRLTECRAVAAELEEMGLTDSEELNELRKGCENL